MMSSETDGGLASIPEFKPESEILRKIILELPDEAGKLEELKKIRLISKSWYESVGNFYRTEPGQKYLAHFNGEKRSFVESAGFGRNLSGIYKLDFKDLKVSRSEWYLMKVWLRLNNLNMIQKLELKDNLLTWQETIQVLAKFSSIVNFKYTQTASDKTCQNIFNLFEAQFKNFSLNNDNEGVKKIRGFFATCGVRGFLPNLKSVEMDIVHVKISNVLAIILAASQGQLEEFIVTIDHMGMFNAILKGSIVKFPELKMGWFKYIKKFANSLKKVKLAIDSTRGINYRVQDQIAGRIFEIFESRDMDQFTEIENLVIKIPMVKDDFTCPGLESYVRSLDKLKKFQLLLLTEQIEFEPNNVSDDGTNNFRYYKTLQVPKKENCKVNFGPYNSAETGLEHIGNFAEIVTKLVICPNETCTISPEEILPFCENCTDLDVSWNLVNSEFWPNFGVTEICLKFPYLQKLTLFRMGNSLRTQAQLKDADLQLIISQYQDLKSLKLGNCVRFLTDAGLTGLTSDCLKNQLYGDIEDKKSVERNGFPISHLKDLETLSIKSYSEEVDDITDVSAQFAFEDMPKLRRIKLMNTNISADGIRMIIEKSGSQSITISLQNEILEPIL